MKTYIKYNQRQVTDDNFQPWITLNWLYDLSFFLDFPEYQNEKIISVIDWDRFIPMWDIKLWLIEHNFTPEELEEFKTTIPTEFNLEVLTSEEIKQFIRDNTEFEEIEDWKFLIYDEFEDFWETTPAKYLLI